MTSFFIGAVLLALLAIAFVVVPLRRGATAAKVDRLAMNQAIFDQKKAELEQEFANAVYSREEYEDALVELQRTFLDDVRGADSNRVGQAVSVKGLAVMLILLIPVSAGLLYLQFSTGFQVNSQSQNQVAGQQQSMDDAITALLARLQEQPGDIEGWKLLGRSYFAQQDYAKAAQVYEKLKQITQSSDPDALVGLAEASAYMINMRFTSEHKRLLRTALEINPEHERALWYSGYAAYQNEDYRRAAEYWQRLLEQVPPGQEDVKSALSKFLADAQQKAGMESVATASSQQASEGKQTEGRQIQVTVTIDPALTEQVNDSDTLFVYARAAQGPKMPLALVRLQPANWPLSVNLNQQQSMIENMSLASFDVVQVIARVSKSGMATPQTGDLIGESEPIDLQTNSQPVTVQISTIVP